MNSLVNVETVPVLATPDKCTGCGACANVCSRSAITLQWNEEGFLSPVVNTAACVHCGMCSKTCPVLDSQEKFSHLPMERANAYGGWHKERATRQASSSGGIFTALAENIINKGGVVFGVAQRDDLTAEFVGISTVEELSRLRGSKYTQAEVGTCYRDVKVTLKAGKWVLFSGTPCQVAGLLAYLRVPYPQLITCDIACHGVPSRHLYDSYLRLKEIKAGSPITSVKFRVKQPNWQNFSVRTEYTAADSTETVHGVDEYMRGFLSDCCLNQACYTCNWGAPHRSDITLADYWGVQQTHPAWNADAGVSIIYANTDIGQALLDECSHVLELFRENDENLRIASTYNGGLMSRDDMYQPKRRLRFLDDLQKDELPVALKKHLCDTINKPRKDVAILGMWMTCNYGAVFTTHALYRVIESMGLDPILLDVSVGNDARYRDENTVFRRFIATEKLQKSPYIDVSQLSEWNDKADTFLVGSDQVWRYEYMRESVSAFFLNFVQGGKRRIAYGSSFGIETAEYPAEVMAEAAACLQCFDGVSSREQSGINILRNQFSVDSTFVLDPVFLRSAEDWSSSAARAERKPTGKYVLSYILDPTPDKRAMLLHLKEREELPLINMVDAQFDFEGKKAALNLPDVIENLTLEEWLYHVMHCSHFITDSFHGVCFALIFNKPFTCIANAKRGYPRFTSLLELTGQMGRMVPEHAVPGMLDNMSDTDWVQVNRALDAEKLQSLQWLRDALFGIQNGQRVQSSMLLHHINTHVEKSKKFRDESREIVDNMVCWLNRLRMEVKLQGGDEESFNVSGVESMQCSSPEWLCRGGHGVMLIGETGEYTLCITIKKSGRLELYFHGIEVRGRSGRIPCRVDVVSLRIDGKEHGYHEVWHDEAYITQFEVSAGQTITIEINSRPHLHTNEEMMQLLEAYYPHASWKPDYRNQILSLLQSRFAAQRNVSLPELYIQTKEHKKELQSLQTEYDILLRGLDSLKSTSAEDYSSLTSQLDKLYQTSIKQTNTIAKLTDVVEEQKQIINIQRENLDRLKTRIQESERAQEQVQERTRMALDDSLRIQHLIILVPRLKRQYQLLRLKKIFSFGNKRQRYKQKIKAIKSIIRQYNELLRQARRQETI